MGNNQRARQRVNTPVVPSTPDGTVPYTDPLPTPEADAAAPDGDARPTRPSRPDDPGLRPSDTSNDQRR
jgi:hypothetical protein